MRFRSPIRLSAEVGISLFGATSMQLQLVGTGPEVAVPCFGLKADR